MRPSDFYEKMSIEERAQYLKDFSAKYLLQIKSSAKRHCVPEKLLDYIIFNEMVDYSLTEEIVEERNIMSVKGLGNTLGPAQIHIKTAIRYKLMNPIIEQVLKMIKQSYPSYLSEDDFRKAYYKPILRSLLINDALNIDAAAELMKIYLDELCKRYKNKKISKVFLVDIAHGCDLKDFCCATPKCDIDQDVPKCLVQGMAAVWNDGIDGALSITNQDIWDLNGKKAKKTNLRNHAMIAGYNYDAIQEVFKYLRQK
jgi:hypothetical protein